mgnify:FL=1
MELPGQEIPREPAPASKPPAAVFLSATIVIFFLTLGAADFVGFVPNYIDGDNKVSLSNLPQLGNENSVLPEHITAPSINLSLPVQNPATRDIPTLDSALQNGPVRYIDSAKLGEKGNILIFAHSSHLPIVRNQMYRAFNRISELKEGDSISVFGGGKEYKYKVSKVRQTDASEEVIDLSPKNGTRLTLSTCDTFGKKSARWVVEADFVGVFPVAK